MRPQQRPAQPVIAMSLLLQALALGASAVLVGRPVLYGLALGGKAGVERVLELLRNELELAMALTGCTSLQQIGPHLLLRCSSNGLVPVTAEQGASGSSSSPTPRSRL